MSHGHLGYAGNDILMGSAEPALDANNIMSGLGGDDIIYGLSGYDTLYGDRFPTGEIADDGRPRGIPGNDTLYGGAGSDHLYGEEGNDWLDGGDDNDWLRGGANDDTLYGGQGNDTLDGDSFGISSGQIGNDYMAGGIGNDTYIVNTFNDTIFENANEGIDTVESFVSYWLPSNVENLTLKLGFFLNGGGNELNNQITGTSDPNHLYGYGGNDTLYGYWGNDTLQGHEGSDYLYGGDGNDILDGGDGLDYLDGGAGNDTLQGGTGDDVYIVDSMGDTIMDSPGTGIETVVSYVSWDLRRQNPTSPLINTGLDNLALGGSSAINGIGNQLNNTINGNSGNNTLNGMEGDDRLYGRDGSDSLIGGTGNDFLAGGMGNDTLLGGAGQDNFYFSSKTEGVDRIVDFSVVSDTIQISKSGFGGGLESGTLLASRFTFGSAATTSSHRFIYNAGDLFFDVDGVGGSAQVLIAQLSGNPAINHNDILVMG